MILLVTTTVIEEDHGEKEGAPGPRSTNPGAKSCARSSPPKPYATLAEVTAEFMRRTELTVTAATVLKALRQAGVKRKRGAVVVKRRAEEESKRYGYRNEHRRQEPEQRYPSCLTQTEWELVADLFEQPGKRGRPPQYSRWEMVNACCYVVRNGCSWRMLPHEVSTLGECVSHLPALGCGRQVRADA